MAVRGAGNRLGGGAGGEWRVCKQSLILKYMFEVIYTIFMSWSKNLKKNLKSYPFKKTGYPFSESYPFKEIGNIQECTHLSAL